MTHDQASRRARRVATLALLIALVGCPALAQPARAGSYTVSGTCSAWSPWGTTATWVAVFPACPSLYERNVLGNFTTAAGVGGGWRFDAPPGTAISTIALNGIMLAEHGWQAAIYTEGPNAHTLEGCPGATCPGASKGLNTTYDGQGASAVTTRVRCGLVGGCANTAINGQIILSGATVTLVDGTAPSVAVVGGSALGSWISATRDVVISASDNSGVQVTRLLVDGASEASSAWSCDYSLRVPCPSGSTDLSLPTYGLADGTHVVAGQAVDASGNVGNSGAVPIHVDNTAPTQPLGLAVTGGAGWRGTDQFSILWQDPPQHFAPIAAAAYRLCPRLATGGDAEWTQKRCVTDSRSGATITQINDLKLPSTGLWDLRLWLVDSAGNQQPASAAQIDGLGYDDTPPADVAFLASDPQNPALVHVRADDATSGLTAGVIEIRRDGQNAWQPLATQIDGDGLSAFVDDEVLPKGLYFLRARVTNAAGLESSDDRTAGGDPATIRLPVRAASRLVAGRPQRRCRRRGGRRHCGVRLLTRPGASVRHPTRLRGRLTVGGKPMAGVALQVWGRLNLPGAAWARIGTVTTSTTGRFSYRVRRGAARTIRFRYPGTNLIRGHNRDIALRVHAAPTFRPSRRTVINGEYVTFSGKLRGGWLPKGGVLVELQVRTRGEWRTFAQPRADDHTGRYSYQYRFETVSGTASFKFRARVRRQPGYPFTTGASRPARVRVRGL
jgi:hypothetical protein